MGIVLSKFKVKGIKNLEKEIVLDFLRLKTKVESYRTVTSIYGANGAGKSAIVHGAELLKRLLAERNMLLNTSSRDHVLCLMNKNIGGVNIEVEYFVVDEKEIYNKYVYVVNLYNEFDSVNIKYEKLAQLKNSKENIVYEISDGKMISDNKLSDEHYDYCNGKLLNRTYFETSLYYSINLVRNKNSVYVTKEQKSINEFFGPLNELVANLDFLLLSDEINEQRMYNMDFKNYKEVSQAIAQSNLNLPDTKRKNVVHKNHIDKLRSRVKRMAEFIKLFKSDLTDIKLDTKINEDFYFYNYEFVYGNYSVHYEFESNGIKRLVNLFSYIERLHDNNCVIFIDELDVNINDIYLIKLIEYFATYIKGQIVFTTHSTSPMEVVSKKAVRDKSQICFLTKDNDIEMWKHVGSFSPSSIYRKGQIKGLPFTIDAIDFVDIFKKSKTVN